MELVSVVDGALAVASVPFRLGADVGLLLVKVGVDARLVVRFWQIALYVLKLAFNLLVSQFETLLTNLYLRCILEPTLEHLAHLGIELLLVGSYLLKLPLDSEVRVSLLRRVLINFLDNLLTVLLQSGGCDVRVSVWFSLLLNLLIEVINFISLEALLLLELAVVWPQPNHRVQQADRGGAERDGEDSEPLAWGVLTLLLVLIVGVVKAAI